MIMINNFLLTSLIFASGYDFLTILLTSVILFSTSVNAEVVVKPVIH